MDITVICVSRKSVLWKGRFFRCPAEADTLCGVDVDLGHICRSHMTLEPGITP